MPNYSVTLICQYGYQSVVRDGGVSAVQCSAVLIMFVKVLVVGLALLVDPTALLSCYTCR